MARINTDLTRFLPGMKLARKKLKEPRIVRGTELAEMMGATWRILKARILRDSAFPVAERGANGKAWAFEAIASLDYLIADTERMAQQRVKMAAEMARLAGAAVEDGPQLPVDDIAIGSVGRAVDSASDWAAQARALNATAQAQMTTHRLKQLQGEYTLAEAHDRVVSTIYSTVQTVLLSRAAKLDPAGIWDPDLRKSVEDEYKNGLLEVRTALEQELRALRA